ncbi:MAG: hypothetical protein WBA51_19515 [Erythrobacter sp.]
MLDIPQDLPVPQRLKELRRAIELSEAALAICDRQDCSFAAISLSQAVEQLKLLEYRTSTTKV